jgi:2-dehydro-3-deoxygalactonokinase
VSQGAVAIADWGTTRLRLWLLDRAGEVIAERRSDEGLLSAQPDRFSAILERHLADMGAGAELPVIICGMAGSRQGWLEAPYVTVPASLGDIFGGAVRIPGQRRDIRIVPGLAQRAADAPDVMRGEETQLAGASAALSSGRRVVCMPGTHSKWVELGDGTVTRFQTFMTGELFSVLSGHSILTHAVGPKPAPVPVGSAAFARACGAALADGGDVSTRLFRLRAATLLQGLGPEDAAASLSGLLIGGEIASALRAFPLSGHPVVLVASGAMRDLYAAALTLAGQAVETIDADTAVRVGLCQAARHHGMLADEGAAA